MEKKIEELVAKGDDEWPVVQVLQCEIAPQEKHQWIGHRSTSVAAYVCFGLAHLFRSSVKSDNYIYVGDMQEEPPWSEYYEQLDFLKKSLIMFNMSYTVAENVDIWERPGPSPSATVELTVKQNEIVEADILFL